MAFFTNGAWLEAQGILGVVDDLNTLHLIKENGEALTRRTSNQLKLSYPIVNIVVHDGSSSERPGFYIFTSDGMVHKFDYMQDHEANLQKVAILIQDAVSAKTPQLPHSVSCVDYHQDHSLVVLIGNPNAFLSSNGSSGACFLYVLHFNGNLEFSLSFPSLQLEGTFFPPKDQATFASSAKVRISPQSKHIATLDLNGSVNIFVLANDKRSASLHPPRNGTQLSDVKDISWWTDNILMVVKEKGSINMYSISGNRVVSEDGHVLSTPQLEKARAVEGYTFILQSSRYEGNNTFEEVDIPEKYSILIRGNRYKEALDFACKHNLDKDEVLKAQWLSSDGDVHDIDTYLANIKDQVFVLSECLNKVGPTEIALKALLSFGLRITDRFKFSKLDNSIDTSAWDSRIIRLRLLRYNDLLETFLGINMGRYVMTIIMIFFTHIDAIRSTS
uniref:Uncharacterized protein n=1 Tax=Oryza nivara TaxID=4536 RepID=A0A0E0J8B6_ORYNI